MGEDQHNEVPLASIDSRQAADKEKTSVSQIFFASSTRTTIMSTFVNGGHRWQGVPRTFTHAHTDAPLGRGLAAAAGSGDPDEFRFDAFGTGDTRERVDEESGYGVSASGTLGGLAVAAFELMRIDAADPDLATEGRAGPAPVSMRRCVTLGSAGVRV